MQVVSSLDRRRFRPVLIAGPDGLLTAEAHALQGVELQLIPSLGRRCNCCTIACPLGTRRDLPTAPAKDCPHHSSKSWYPRARRCLVGQCSRILHNTRVWCDACQPFWLQRLLIGLEWMVGRVTTHWIAVSQADRRQGLEWDCLRPPQVSVVRPGIDPRAFSVRIESAGTTVSGHTGEWVLRICSWGRSRV